ncbi:hypothetical protein [Niveibacterium microcysteis]|uniref:Uncharacterized protein n=1 Tax=Niveibacterium microcysteis TaxID=2811415 RepID=A0ABX7M9K8_9RHOO|nr:hypothetical protein [Niveibacterium microcysteis]QSI77155.1 hypothetical protein JY500_00450 [Niveibacterium microcysteis]
MNALRIRPTQAFVAALIAIAGFAATVGSTLVGYQSVASLAIAAVPAMRLSQQLVQTSDPARARKGA